MIGGCKTAILQVKTVDSSNAIGENVPEWVNVAELVGWLDLLSGNSDIKNYNAKVQDSSHVFIMDFTNWTSLNSDYTWNPYKLINGIITNAGETVDVSAINSRLVIDDLQYNITYFDNPMSLNKQIEIYLKYLGGGIGVN